VLCAPWKTHPREDALYHVSDTNIKLGWIFNFTLVLSVPFKYSKETKVCYNNFGEELWPRETLYIAPSWSWALLDGFIIYPYNNKIIYSGNNYPLINVIKSLVKLED
jgi:hypothetical protein